MAKDMEDNIKATSEALKAVAKNAEEAKEKVQEVTEATKGGAEKSKKLSTNWEAVSASTSAALGVLSSGLRASNPLLSQLFGSLQKMVPLMKDIAKAAFKGGKELKAAFAETGIGLLVIAITEVISLIDSAIKKSREGAAEVRELLTALREEVDEWYNSRLNEDAQYIASYNKYKKAVEDAEAEYEKVAERNEGNRNSKRAKRLKKEYEDALTALNEFEKQHELDVKQRNAKIAAEEEKKRKEDERKRKEDETKRYEEELARLKSLISSTTGYSIKKISDDIAFLQNQLKEKSDDDPEKAYIVERITALSKELTTLEGLLPRVTNGITEVQHVVSTASDGLMTGFEVGIGGAVNHIETFDEKVKKVYGHLKKYGVEYLDSVGNLTSGLADMLESDEKNSKKNAKKIKNLRIATATIDMLSGAIKAFTQAQELGPIAGPIVGGINAAAVTAMGIANINKIKSTDTESGSTANVGTTASVSYSVPQAQQVYVQNDNFSSTLESIDSKIGNTQTVLVVDDFNKVNDNKNRVKVQASF